MQPDPNHPKYYLFDVPHELRRRVLDLCVKRLWQDAHDLLCQNGFTQYTFGDLQSFYDWAPAELPREGRDVTSEHPGPSIEAAPSPVLPVTRPPSPSVSSVAETSRPNCPAPAAPRKRRSKITRLPKEIRDELNSRLENGATYASVIDWLSSKGHPGFNETNLSWWKNGGYQDWLRHEERKQESRALRDWSAALAGRKDPTLLADALSNFTGAKLHRLLCALDYEAIARQLQARPEVCIRYFNSAIRTGRVSLEAARVAHFVETTRDKRAPTMAEIEDIERRLNLL